MESFIRGHGSGARGLPTGGALIAPVGRSLPRGFGRSFCEASHCFAIARPPFPKSAWDNEPDLAVQARQGRDSSSSDRPDSIDVFRCLEISRRRSKKLLGCYGDLWPLYRSTPERSPPYRSNSMEESSIETSIRYDFTVDSSIKEFSAAKFHRKESLYMTRIATRIEMCMSTSAPVLTAIPCSMTTQWSTVAWSVDRLVVRLVGRPVGWSKSSDRFICDRRSQ